MKPKPKLAEGFRGGWAYYMSLHCLIGKGNGNPLQYSCLENPMDGGAGRLLSMGSLRVGYDWVTSFSLFTLMHWRRKWQRSRVLAWRIPRMGEPGGLPSIGSLRVGQDWSDLAAAAAIALYIKWGLTTATSWGEDHTTDLEGSRWPWESKWC